MAEEQKPTRSLTTAQPQKVELFAYDTNSKSFNSINLVDGGIPVRIIGGNAGGGSSMEFLGGTSAPTAETGNSGDVYINTTTGDLYKKEDGEWGEPITNLKGPKGDKGTTGSAGSPGAAGATWLFGSAAPTATQGKDTDFYINTTNFDVYHKASGAWAKDGNIKGTKGDAGSAGSPGAAGATWLSGAVDPTAEQGKNTDWYLNTATYDIYAKENGAWVKKGNLKGPKGDKGDPGAAGFGTQAQYTEIINRLNAAEQRLAALETPETGA